MISRQRKHLLHGKSLCHGMVLYNNFIWRDFLDPRLQKRLNLSGFDAVFDVRTHPILERLSQLLPTMHQRDSRAVSIQIQRGFRSGVFSADDHHVLIPVFVRLRIVMGDMGKIFARHA